MGYQGIFGQFRAERRYILPFSSELISSLELSDTKVYEPYIRDLLGTITRYIIRWELPTLLWYCLP